MESELHAEIRTLVGRGEWTAECSRLWEMIQAEIAGRTEMLEAANAAWRRLASGEQPKEE